MSVRTRAVLDGSDGLAITRIEDEAEQLAAFEAAKSGGVSVRVAKSIQKRETTAKEHGEPRPHDNVKHATRAIYAAIDRLGVLLLNI